MDNKCKKIINIFILSRSVTLQITKQKQYKKTKNSDTQADNSKQTQREKANSHRNLNITAMLRALEI